MGNDVEELLRDEMRRTTGQVSMGPALAGQLAGRAARKHRRWLFARAGAAAGTALGVVAGFAIAGALTAAHSGTGTPRVQTAAYVLGQVNRALARAPRLVHIEWRPLTPGPPQMSSGWMYNESAQTQESVYGAAGGRILNQDVVHVSGPNHELTVTIVNYQARTWSRQTVRLTGGPGPGGSCRRPTLAGYDVSAATLRKLVSCGVFVVAGRQRVDGGPTMKLVLVKTGSMKPRPAETVWVNASTYLPVRVLISVPGELHMQSDLQWLPVTPANLAHLKLTIPVGFKHVHLR